MMNFFKKQRGLSLFETMLAVMLVGGVIAILMNVESGSKSSDNTTILAQDISLLLNKSLEKAESEPNTTITVDINGIASYLGVSTSFVNSLMGRGLKEYTLKISTGVKDSGEMGSPEYPGGYDTNSCSELRVYITNASSYSWLYDQALSDNPPPGNTGFEGNGHFSPDKGDPKNLDTTPIAPGQTVWMMYESGSTIKKYLYFRSTIGDHIIGYYLFKDNGEVGELKVKTHVQQGLNFTREGQQKANAHCGSKNDTSAEKPGRIYYIIFDPAPQAITVDTELSSIKQAKIVSSKTYGVIDHQHLAKLDLISSTPIKMTLNDKKINYTFNQTCAEGPLDSTDEYNVLIEDPPSPCAYYVDDGTVTNY